MGIIPQGRKLTDEQWEKRKSLLIAMDIASSAYLARGDEESWRLLVSVSEEWHRFWPTATQDEQAS